MDYSWEGSYLRRDVREIVKRPPSEYFRRQIHSCFWFERSGIAEAIDSVGADHLMFETDFPHPTCIYPDGLEFAAAALDGVAEDAVAGIMGLNAARLYNIPLPTV